MILEMYDLNLRVFGKLLGLIKQKSKLNLYLSK